MENLNEVIDLNPINTKTFIKSAKNKNKNMKKLKEKIIELLNSSSCHGISNMLRASNSFLRIIWLIFFLLSTCLCATYAIGLILDFLKYNTVTNIEIITEQQSLFPTASFCAKPSFTASIDQIILSARFERNDITNYSQVFEEFTDSSFGKCFRFNSGRNIYNETIDLLNSTIGGWGNRLRLRILIDYNDDENDFGELIVNIHNHSFPPYEFDQDAHWLKTGTYNFYQIDRQFNENLGEPYSNCLKDVSLFKENKTILDFFENLKRTYSQSDCSVMCSHLFALEQSNCSCNSQLNNFERDCIKYGYQIDETEVQKCIDKFLKEFRLKYQAEKCAKYCPIKCDSMSFSITPFFKPFPSHGNISNKTKIENNIQRFNTYEEVNKHLVILVIYYKELQYTLVKKEAKTETFNFVANFGGIMGLFLGVSFLSFVEIIEIFLEIFFALLRTD